MTDEKPRYPDFSFESQMKALRNACLVALILFIIIATTIFVSMSFMTPEQREDFIENLNPPRLEFEHEPPTTPIQDPGAPGVVIPPSDDGLIPEDAPPRFEYDVPEGEM